MRRATLTTFPSLHHTRTRPPPPSEALKCPNLANTVSSFAQDFLPGGLNLSHPRCILCIAASTTGWFRYRTDRGGDHFCMGARLRRESGRSRSDLRTGGGGGGPDAGEGRGDFRVLGSTG